VEPVQSPDWIRDAWRGTRNEFASFLRTAARFVLHPAQFGRRWAAEGARELNPIGFAATSFAVVGVIATAISHLGGWQHDDASSSVIHELLSWLLPYAYFVALGIIQHLCLKIFRSRRPLRDSCAMALYAGGGAGIPTQLVGSIFAVVLKRLGLPLSYSNETLGWAASPVFLFTWGSLVAFFVTLGAAQAALHQARAWKVIIASLLAILVTGLLFGYFDPPGNYGMHLKLRFMPTDHGFDAPL